MSKADRLKKSVPSFVSTDAVMKNIYEAQGEQLDKFETDKEDLQNQFFVDTATWGLRYWEQFLNIATDVTKSLIARRAAIKAKLMGNTTLTKAALTSLLTSFGYAGVTIGENANMLTMNSTSKVDNSSITSLMSTLNDIIPAHLDASVMFASDIVNIDYLSENNSYIDMYSPTSVYKKELATFDLEPGVDTYVYMMNVPSTNPTSTGTKVTLDYYEAITADDLIFDTAFPINNMAKDPNWENGFLATVGGTWAWVDGPSSYDYPHGTRCSTPYANQYIEFEGNYVKVTGAMGPGYGKMKIYIDQHEEATIDCYSPTETWNNVLFEKSNIGDARHNIQIWISDSKNAASTGNTITLQTLYWHPYRDVRSFPDTEPAYAVGLGDTFNDWPVETNANHSSGSAIYSTRLYEQSVVGFDNMKSVTFYGKTGTDGGMLEISKTAPGDIGCMDAEIPSYRTGIYASDSLKTLTYSKDYYINIGKSNECAIICRSMIDGKLKYQANLTDLLGIKKLYVGYETNINVIEAIVDKYDNLFLLVVDTGYSYITHSYTDIGPMFMVKLDSNGNYLGRVSPIGAHYSNLTNSHLAYSSVGDFICMLSRKGSTTVYENHYTVIDTNTMQILKDVSYTFNGDVSYSPTEVIGCIGTDIYTFEPNVGTTATTHYIVRRDRNLIIKNQVQITASSSKNYVIGKDRIYFGYGTYTSNDVFQNVQSPYVMCYNADLTVNFVAKAAPLGIRFNVSPDDNTVYGCKASDYATQFAISRYKTDMTEDWTAVVYYKTASYSGPLYNDANYMDMFIDKDGYIRAANKKALGYKKKYKVFRAGGR